MSVRIWLDGDFVTLNPSRPRAEALVERDGVIVYVGAAAEAVDRAGDGAELRRLGGATVVPGFNDNHVHAVHMGDHELAPDLSGLDEEGIVELLRERFPDPAPGETIRAFNWDYPSCPNPRKELLDAAFPRNPVVLSQYGGHGQWMNGQALRAVGIRRGGPDPDSGSVLRDEGGDPTGVVRDLGDTPLSRRRNRAIFYDPVQREKRVDIALASFARLGITSVQDNTWYWPELLGLRRRYDAGDLRCRFSCWPLARRPGLRVAMDLAFALGVGVPDWIRPGPIKHFLDGTFSTRNACLSEPFVGTVEGEVPGGNSCPDPEAPVAELSFLARAGRQGAFHIIGDRGIEIFLDAYEEVLARYPKLAELRIRIEHAQLVRPEDVPRLRKLGVLVAAQPSALNSPEKDAALLGRDRALRAYPYRSLLDGGVHLSFGSDIPGESGCDPIAAIAMAANREGPERIGAEDALRCYTLGSAYAEFAEARLGSLEPGKLADFAALSQDITAVPRERIGDTRVVETVVGGRSVYREGSPSS